MRLLRRTILPLLLVFAFAGTSQATQIVGFGQNGTVNVLTGTDNGNGTTTLSATASVNITNIIVGATDPLAIFTFNATSTDAAQLLLGNTVISQRYAGSFTLTNSTNTETYLAGTFGAALEFGGNGATGALLTANSGPQSPPLTLSTMLPITLLTPESFGLTLSNITPALHLSTANGDTIASFSSSFVGTADAETSAVPEPASLSLLGLGLVAIGRKISQRRA